MQSNEQDIQRAMALAQTDTARQLLQLLQSRDSAQLRRIMDSAARGDFTQAQQELSALMEDPQAQKLLRQLGK